MYCPLTFSEFKKRMVFVMDWISEQILGGVQAFFANIFQELLVFLGDIITTIMGYSYSVLYFPIVQEAMLYSQGLAFTILAAKVAAEAFKTYILHSNGDVDADPQGLLISTIKAVAVIAALPWGLRWFFQLGTAIARDIANLPVAMPVSESIWGFFRVISPDVTIVFIFMGLIGIIFIVIIAVQSLIRGAHLGMLAVIGPFLAIGLVGGEGNSGLFQIWLKEVAVVCFSQAIQVFMFMASGYALGLIAGGYPWFLAALVFLAWLWATVKTPAVIKQMTYSSGVGGVAGGAARSGGTMILVRKMMTRGA